jgi:uncharacterized protein (DUF1697 family)
MIYVALLRGINLGSRNRVAMADLRALLEGLGARDVRTHLVSGNVVFNVNGRAPALERSIERRLRDEVGVPARVLVRTAAEIQAVVKRNPFATRGADTTNLHVTFLDAAPPKARVKELEALDFGADRLRVIGREAYLSTPAGYGRSKLSTLNLEKRLGVAGTNRNWNTVTALAGLAGDKG